jgi:ribonuclease HII
VNSKLPSEGLQLTLFPHQVHHLIGVDEVGRGCLAGPVVAGAVAFSAATLNAALQGSLDRLNDSKQLSANTREKLSATINSCAHAGVGAASVAEIDLLGITRATDLAMERAIDSVVSQLGADSSSLAILVDGRRPIEQLGYRQIAIIAADNKSASVAAASIVAKVHRDALMSTLSLDYPQYGWADNKGYPAPSHLKAILEQGRCKLHRAGFGQPQHREGEEPLPLFR